MVTKEYVHYGSSEFLLSRFRRIQNRPLFPKPNGGLWASRSDYPLSWKKWCKKENYNTWNLKESFSFHLDEKTRILTITSAEQLLSLPRCSFEKIKVKISKNWEFFLEVFEEINKSKFYLDFEKISQDYDAIEVIISSDNLLDELLYGWDCDSLLVLNPSVIIPKKTEINL